MQRTGARTGQPRVLLVEDEPAILADSERLIGQWHDPARHALQRIVVAPCSVATVPSCRSVRSGGNAGVVASGAGVPTSSSASTARWR